VCALQSDAGSGSKRISDDGVAEGHVPFEAYALDTWNRSVSENTQALRNPNGTFGQALPAAVNTDGIRWITPVECERLQDCDDGWTEPAGLDSARYRALGNAVTVSVPEWLFGRMLQVES